MSFCGDEYSNSKTHAVDQAPRPQMTAVSTSAVRIGTIAKSARLNGASAKTFSAAGKNKQKTSREFQRVVESYAKEFERRAIIDAINANIDDELPF